MCRLFGFRSVIQSQVHRSLVGADNALSVQSVDHPHGWGVAFYQADVPHIVKSASPAFEDQIFRRVSGVVAAQTVVAHVRKATVGERNILNSHPFQFGRWVMAHNGEIHRFGEVKPALLDAVSPRLRRFILGDTDSELLFFLFLTELQQRAPLDARGAPVSDVAASLRGAVQLVRELADGEGDDARSLLTVCVTDGHAMIGHQGGKPLFFSTYKQRCLDRDSCPFLAPECEAPTQTGRVNHLVLSSEPSGGDNTWIPLEDGETIGVDWRMHLHRGQRGAFTPVSRQAAPADSGAQPGPRAGC